MDKFKIGEKVRIHATKTSSDGVKENDGKIVTIKAKCDFYSKAYILEEFGDKHIWHENCFRKL